jgi:hypothetical protein
VIVVVIIMAVVILVVVIVVVEISIDNHTDIPCRSAEDDIKILLIC